MHKFNVDVTTPSAPDALALLSMGSVLMFAETKSGQRVEYHILRPSGVAITVDGQVVHHTLGEERRDVASAVAAFRRAAAIR